MKIVNRKEFLALPSGIVYSLYRPQVISGLFIKQESYSNDWNYQDMIDSVDCNSSEERADILFGAEYAENFRMDYYSIDRDGLFEEDQMFIVYDQDDMASLINRLMDTLENYPI